MHHKISTTIRHITHQGIVINHKNIYDLFLITL